MIDPRGMTVQQWFDAITLDAGVDWASGRLDDPSKWQDFAAGIVRAPSLAQRALPDPYYFSDWQEWAQRAFLMLEGSG